MKGIVASLVLLALLAGAAVLGGAMLLGETSQETPQQEEPEWLSPSDIGYEYLNLTGDVVSPSEAEVVHIWNTKDDYFFNKTSGIQFTNHFAEFWTRNVFCAGYKTDKWNYDCNDALPFTWSIDSDNLTYVNITGYRVKTIGTKTVNLSLKYSLYVNDIELTIIPAIENIGSENINNDIGFAWRLTDIKIDNTYENDYIRIWNNSDGTYENLNLSNDLHLNYTNLSMTKFKMMDRQEYLRLRWNENLNYKLMIDSNKNNYNAPTTLAINAGVLAVGQKKETKLYWIDAVDTTSSGTDSGTITLTVPHTCTGTESDSVLIVTVQVTDASETDRIIQSVTHNNEPLTHLPGAVADDDIEQRTEIWYRLNPTTGGTPDIVVTAGGSCTDLSLGAISLTGVSTNILTDTYYFDGSDLAADDPDNVWNDETNADDGDVDTDATATVNGNLVGNYLDIEGTNAPGSGDTIRGVRARFHYGTAFTVYYDLDVPSGGWTWAKIQALEIRATRFAGPAMEVNIFPDGADKTTVANSIGNVGSANRPESSILSKVEIEVLSGDIVMNTTTDANTHPTLNITTVDNSYIVDSLAIAESDGSKIGVQHKSIHKTDVGGDTHASQYVNESGIGLQVMNYSDVDQDKSWAMSAVAISLLSAVDEVAPDNVGFLPPTPNNDTNLSQDNYMVNVSFNDSNPNSCQLELTNTSGTINYTMTQGGNASEWKMNTSHSNNMTYFTAYCRDDVGNWNNSETRFVNISGVAVDNTTFNMTLPLQTPVQSAPTGPAAQPIEINSSSKTEAGINASVVSGVPQNNTYAMFEFKNAGNVNLKWIIELNESTPSCIDLNGSWDSAGSSVFNLNATTNATVNWSIAPNEIETVHIFGDALDCTVNDNAAITITHYSQKA